MAIGEVSKRPRHPYVHVHITTHASPPLSKRSPRFLMIYEKSREKGAHRTRSFGVRLRVKKRSAQGRSAEVPHWGCSEDVVDGGLDELRVEVEYVCF
jgi:hypothetical protein